METRPPLRRTLLNVAVLTLALGATVAISWFVFGGRGASLGPIRVLRESWPSIFASQAVLAAAILFVFARRRASELSVRLLILLVAGAWLGELLVLTVGGTLFAGELVPTVAWFYWLIGTGGPLQPLAAIAGGLVGMWSLPSPGVNHSSGRGVGPQRVE